MFHLDTSTVVGIALAWLLASFAGAAFIVRARDAHRAGLVPVGEPENHEPRPHSR